MPLTSEPQHLRVGVLSSPNGTSTKILRALNLIHAVVLDDPDPNAKMLQWAKGANVPVKSRTHKPKAAFEEFVTEFFENQKIDLILLVGFMRILSDDFVNRWKGKIINIHPSLLPEFAGGMNLDVHKAVIDAKKLISGCTVHYVTPGKVDCGPILIQIKCQVEPGETADTLKDKVQRDEAKALLLAVAAHSQNPNACEDLLSKVISPIIVQPANLRTNWLPSFKSLPMPKFPEPPSALTCVKIAAAAGIVGLMANKLRST